MRRWPLFPFGSKMADKNSLADADLIGSILPGMDSALSALFTGESLSRASFLPSNSEESFSLAGSSGFSPSHRSFSLHDHVLSDGLRGFSPVHLTPERVVLSTPKCLASCKSVQFYDTTVSLLPSELKLVQNCGSVSVSGRGVSRRAKSESPTRRPGLSVANIAAGTSSSGTGYKIPKVSKVAQPKTAQPTPDVRGFSSDDDSAANDSDSDADHPDHSSSSSSRDSDDDSYRLTDKKSRRKRKMSNDKELLDGSHSMFDPSGDKRSKLSKVQDTYVRKMFTKLIKAEDIEDSFTALGMEKSSSSLLQVRNLDPDLLDILPGASFVAKADKSFTAVEGRVLRAATPALTLWGELQAAREGNSDSVDVNKLITLAEAAVCCIGQASVELKFQRRLAVAGKILKDRKKAKVVLAQNEDVLEREKKYLFGTAFTSKLVKKITRQNKLKETLKKVGGQKPFKKGKMRNNPGKPFKNFGRFADSSPQQQPFRGAPRGGGSNRGGRGKGPKKPDRYVPTSFSKPESICVSSTKRFRFKGRKIKRIVRKYCLSYQTKSLSNVVQSGFQTCGSSSKTRGSHSSLHTELADSYSGSVDSGCSAGQENPLGQCSLSNKRTQGIEIQSRGIKSSRWGSVEDGRDGSNRTLSKHSTSVHQHTFLKEQKRWKCTPHHQSQTSQSIHRIPTLQNGGHSSLNRHNTRERLHVQDRPIQCILDSSSTFPRQEMDEISLERKAVSIPSVAIRPGTSSQMVHKTPETSHSFLEETGHQKCYIHGRPLGRRVRSRSLSPSHFSHSNPSGVVGICSESKEIHSRSDSSPQRLSRVHHKLRRNVSVVTLDKNSKDSASLPRSSSEENSISKGTNQSTRSTSSNSQGSISSPPTLQETTDDTNSSTAQKSETIQCKTSVKSRVQTRTCLVDRELKRLEWQIVYNNSTSRSAHNRNRRIERRLGCSLQRNFHSRSVEEVRNSNAHQRERVTGSVTSNQSIHKRQTRLSCSSKNRQHHNSESDPENGIYQIQKSVQSNDRPVEILPRQQNNADSRTPARDTEHNSRQGVQDVQRLKQLDVKQGNLRNDNEPVRTSRNRSVCRQNKPPTKEVYQLETRSHSSQNGCVHGEMERIPGVCVPTNLSDREMSGQSTCRTYELDHNYAYLARPTMVCNSVTDDNREPNITTRDEQPSHRSDGRVSSDGSNWCNETGGMESIRQNARNPALSSTARSLLQRKLSNGSKKTYSGPWKRWCCWCSQQSLDPISAPVEAVANYLAEEQIRVGYSALNTTRSAISAYHNKCNGVPIGQHELIKDIMESALKNKPPKPRYTSTWDVNRVLQFIRQLGPNAGLDRKTLTLKLTMLMSLVSVARGHELKVLHLTSMHTETDKVTFSITEKTKTNLKTLEFHRYSWSENLDVVACLEAYIIATQALRDTDSKKTQLLISFKSPHEPVTTSTIARWLRTLMEDAGIDTSKYKAHSTRSAATSKAKVQGLSTNQILQAANWSNAGTFLRFYNKNIDPLPQSSQTKSKFADLVLS